jgi:hypothetical protein
MSRKYTTYRRPSILAQIESGKGTPLELASIVEKLEREGASHKTLKRLRKLVETRLRGTFNSVPVATWTVIHINSFQSLNR